MTLALFSSLPKGCAKVLLVPGELEPHQEAVADNSKNIISPASDEYTRRLKSITPLEKTTRLRRDTSDASETGSGSCRKLYQEVDKSTLEMILHRELRGRQIVFPATVKLPYCLGTCSKVTHANYHHLIQGAGHGSHVATPVCQAEGEGKVTWIVAGPEPVSSNGIPTYSYEVLKLPLEITKCSCYPRY